jgi:DNA binding domain, excisionase family
MTTESNNKVHFEDMPSLIAAQNKEIALMDSVMTKLAEEVRALREMISSFSGKTWRTPVPIERAAEMTGKSVTTLYRYTANGLIPCYKRGKRVLFYEDELLEWIQQGQKESIEERARREDRVIVPMNSDLSKI